MRRGAGPARGRAAAPAPDGGESTPPRVLVVTTYYHPFVGGVETHVRRLAVHLARQGPPPVVLTKAVGGHRPDWDEVDGIDVYRVPPGGPRKGYQKWAMVPPLALAALRLAPRFDVLYCPDYRGIAVAAVGAARLLRRPVVLGGHNLGVLSCAAWDPALEARGIHPEGRIARSLKAPLQRLYRAADAHTGICREIVDEARRVGVPEERIHHVPNAVDLRTFRPPEGEERCAVRDEEGWGEGEVVALFAGRLSAEKGILELLEAWPAVAHGTRVRLAVAGPDMPGHAMDVGERARRYARDRGLTDRVDFLGERSDLPRLLGGADLFVQPSHYESFGISVLEAMATGLPVVATRVGGMLDYLVDGENALLCPPGSPPALAGAVRRLAGDPTLRDRLGRRARTTVEGRFDEESVHRRLDGIFRELHGGVGKGGDRG